MATVNFTIKGSNNPTMIYCRLSHTRSINLWVRTPYLVNPIYWNNEKQEIRDVLAVKNSDEINQKLRKLRPYIFDAINDAYLVGEVLNKEWLEKVVNDSLGRPKHEVKLKNLPYTIYWSDYADHWMNNFSDNYKTNKNTYLDEAKKSEYKFLIALFKKYEGKNRIKLKDIDIDVMNGFINFMIEDNNYAESTTKKHINMFKFFCFRADEANITINKNFKMRIFIPKTTEIKKPYLNEEEIETIYKHDFSKDKRLEATRDALIISLWTGLRSSDFLKRLNVDNFIDDFIEIQTLKTKTDVVIPVHRMIKEILIKRNGKLPKITSRYYNKDVKVVCQECGINQKMLGDKSVKEEGKDKNDKRNIRGMYAKYELIASHIGRRSFATNLIGKVDNKVIMGICGWSTEAMMFKYVQKSNRDYANKLKEYWESDK